MKSKGKYKSILYHLNQRICQLCQQSAKVKGHLKSNLFVNPVKSKTCVPSTMWYTCGTGSFVTRHNNWEMFCTII